MRGSWKPLERSVLSLALVASATSPLDLTWNEMSALSAFRTMENRRKEEAVVRMQRIAKTHPGRAASRLRLVSVRTA
jgi:hypothetical protein